MGSDKRAVKRGARDAMGWRAATTSLPIDEAATLARPINSLCEPPLMRALGIETSCDETAVAIVRRTPMTVAQ
jgi:hypothetical protein